MTSCVLALERPIVRGLCSKAAGVARRHFSTCLNNKKPGGLTEASNLTSIHQASLRSCCRWFRCRSTSICQSSRSPSLLGAIPAVYLVAASTSASPSKLPRLLHATDTFLEYRVLTCSLPLATPSTYWTRPTSFLDFSSATTSTCDDPAYKTPRLQQHTSLLGLDALYVHLSLDVLGSRR